MGRSRRASRTNSGVGYKPAAASRQLVLLAELSEWLEEVGVPLAELTTEAVSEFLQERRRRGETRLVSPMGIRTLIGYLRGAGATPEPSRRVPVGPTEQLLERYHRFLVDDRGLAAVVVAQYETGARLFVDFVTERDVDLGEVSARDVHAFVTRHCAQPVKLAPPELSDAPRGP